jgi:hypothetical protein
VVGVDGVNRLLVVIPRCALVVIVDFEGGTAADSNEEEYGEIIVKE